MKSASLKGFLVTSISNIKKPYAAGLESIDILSIDSEINILYSLHPKFYIARMPGMGD